MSKIPCDVVRDLFPSYIDELTSETSNKMIGEHLAECDACREVLSSMQGGAKFAAAAEEEKKEIDFLKKNKRRNRRIALGSIAAALALVLLIGGIRLFMVGSGSYTNWAPVNMKVVGRNVSFEAVPHDSASAISKLTFTEDENGVVTVQAKSVLASPLHPGSKAGEYTAQTDITEIRVGDRIVWANGASVSAFTADVFNTAHKYIGDMPANNRTAEVLGLTAYLGAFTNELETAKEPYGWKILLSDPISAEKLAQKEQDMDAFGKVIVAVIENLDHVTFVYTGPAGEISRTITKDETTKFLGVPAASCGSNIRLLDELIQKTGLSLNAYSMAVEGESEELWLRIRNETDTELCAIHCDYYRNGQLCSSASGINADGSPFAIGETIWEGVSAAEFGGSWSAEDLLEIEISFETADGKQKIELPNRVRIAPVYYKTMSDFTLVGDAKNGYRLEQ